MQAQGEFLSWWWNYFSKCEIFIISGICYSERRVVYFLDVKSEYIYIYIFLRYQTSNVLSLSSLQIFT